MASSTVLVADVVKKDVVYSAECFDQGYKPLDTNTQLVVEYSIMALEAKYMAPGDTHDTLRKIDGVLDIVNGALIAGAGIAALTASPAAPVLVAMAAVGAFIQFLVKLIPDKRPNKIVEKFKQLEKAIHKLEQQMVAHFADMQAFISEHNFNVNITTDVTVLMNFLRNCLTYHDEQDLENFRLIYKQNTPRKMAYSMASLLEIKSTNPLMTAMQRDGQTKETFNKWKTITMGIFGELMFIEAFASGLLETTDTDLKRVAAQRDKIAGCFEKWADEYKETKSYYWEDFRKFLGPFIEDNVRLNYEQKADAIKRKLKTYLTNDAFYIFVFDQTEWEKDYTYYCKNENDQIIGSWWKGGCHAFVYRSRTEWKKDYHAAIWLEEQIKETSNRKGWSHDLNGARDQVMAALANAYGFYCINKNWGWIRGFTQKDTRYGPGFVSYPGGRLPQDGNIFDKAAIIVAFE